MPPVAVDVLVEAGGWPPEPELAGLAEKAIEAAIGAAGAELPPGAEASLVFSDDERVARLNARWRGKEGATNVLSFPQEAGPMLGDIVLAAETVRREADLAKIPIGHHIAHLVVHGFLHLIGYDHEEDDEAEEMEAKERLALEAIGIPDPYRPSLTDQ